MKKSYVLFVVMLLGILFTVSASAEESTGENITTYTEGVYTYTITDGEASIIDVDEESISGDVVLPEALGNCPVVTLEGGQYYDGFYYCKKITSIHIPKTIKSVGTAFYFVPNLERITVDENNPYLTAIDGVLYNKEVTQMLVYPSGKAYDDFVVPASVKRITGFQNSGSSRIKTLSFEPGSQLEAFDGDSLFYFSYIDELIIPPNCSIENVSIGQSCFVKKLTFEEGREEELFVYIGSAESIDLPATFVGIAEFALSDTKIPSVIIRNPECNIYDSPKTIHSDITIYGYEGSTAHDYARKYTRKIVDLNGNVIDETKYKVKVEFRFADTKEIIDTSDQYTLDRQVSFNFTTTEDVHRMLNATNGILYMDDFYFPINYFSASWSSAFGDKTEYTCKSTKIINANAGDTIVVYMSPNENQGSVTTKLAGGKTNNYGANNAVSTIEGQIRETAKELAEYIDEYISLINGSGKKQKGKNKTNVDNEILQKSAKAIMNAAPNKKIYALSAYKADYEYALCYALATVFNEKTLEEIDLGKINLNKSKEEIGLNLTKNLIKNFGEIDETVTYDKYKIELKINTWGGKAFEGTYSVFYKNSGKQLAFGPLVSSVEATEATLYSYFTSMTDLVNDMLKASMASIFTELSDVTGLSAFREEELSTSVNNALVILEKKGFGKVKDLLMTGRKIYINIKDISSATSDLTVSNLLKTEEKTRELYKIVFNNSFTSSKATDDAAKEIISKIEATRKELYNLLYNKLYGINSDASVITKVGSWFAAKFQCPVDIEVYNADGELIGYVDTLGRHDEFIYYSDGIYIEVRGDKKFVYHPADKTVTFKIYGTDNGSMTYSLEASVDGESVDRINYYDVELSEGCEYSQIIVADTNLSEDMDALALIGDSETYTGEHLSVDDETAHIRVLYSSTKGGKVSGDMYYPKGDCATLYAYAKEGYVFKGWYEDDVCVSEEEVYRFAAVRDFVLEARFEEIEVDDDVETETPVLDRILLSENELLMSQGDQSSLYYLAIPSHSIVNIRWISADTSVATVDENGTVVAVAKGATTITAVDTVTNIRVQCRVVVDGEDSCVYLGHNFKDWYYVNLADCETDGLEQRGCTFCNYLETRSVSATGHSYESVVTPATCKDKGFTTYTCICGNSYTDNYVNTLDHEYTSKVTTPATHLTQGIKTYTCNCGDSYTETIAKLPEHTYAKVVTSPTCTSEGYTTYTCDCGNTYIGNKTPVTDHNYEQGVCTACGDRSKIDNCSCDCHKGGFSGFIWKILCFFYKLFKTNKTCGCGVSHY